MDVESVLKFSDREIRQRRQSSMAGADGRSQAKSLDRETRITKAKLGAELSLQLDKFWMLSWVLRNPDDEAIDNS